MDDGLADLLHRVVALLGEQARAQIDGDDELTYSQLRLLGTLEGEAPMTQHKLAESIGVSDPAVSRALQPLVENGLVGIEQDPTHGRRKLVSLTSRGAELFHRTGIPLAEAFKSLLLERGFPYQRYVDDTARLAVLLTELRRN